MELNKISKRKIGASFEFVVMSEICEKVKELKESDGETYKAFMLALKEEFFIVDFEWVTKRTFLEWIARPNMGLSASEPLRELEWQYHL